MCATYLFKYNLKEVFGDDSTNPATAPSVKCPALENIITIIACYYLIRKASPNVDVEMYREDYMQAIKLLEDIRDGHNNLTELAVKVNEHTDIQRQLSIGYEQSKKQLGTVISGISHDFRTPLTASLGYLRSGL